MKIHKKLLLAIACTTTISLQAQKYVGGDISLLPSYEANGSKYLDKDGNAIPDLLPYLKECGMNAMRVRVFVDPSKASAEERGWGAVQDLEYAKTLGRRIKEQGMALMIDFHYSDTWADPAKQWTPAAWATLTDNELEERIYEYTKDALQQLIAAGAEPDMIQTGNEISYGMLWGTATDPSPKKCFTNSTANWERFCNLLKQAGKACRETCPSAKIIIHTERAAQPDVLKGFYDNMKSYGVDYDIIGLSFYSYYHGTLPMLSKALTTLENNYQDKQIMIVEAGYYHNWQPDVDYDLSATYPVSPEGQQAYTEALTDTLVKHKSVTGLFWWWLEANEYGRTGSSDVTSYWYNAGLFDNQTGRALPALYSLKRFLDTTAGVDRTLADMSHDDSIWFTLDGKKVAKPAKNGVYINNRKKVAIR